jgi:hypothetical protein
MQWIKAKIREWLEVEQCHWMRLSKEEQENNDRILDEMWNAQCDGLACFVSTTSS